MSTSRWSLWRRARTWSRLALKCFWRTIYNKKKKVQRWALRGIIELGQGKSRAFSSFTWAGSRRGIAASCSLYLFGFGFLTRVNEDDLGLTGDSLHRPRRSPIVRELLSSSSVQSPSKYAIREDASSITHVRLFNGLQQIVVVVTLVRPSMIITESW